MNRSGWLCAIALTITCLGCGGGSKSAPEADAATSSNAQQRTVKRSDAGPEQVVYEFLEAVRVANDAQASEMLTKEALQKTAEYDLVVAPPGSDTAGFKVGQVEYVAEDGAHVSSTWTDIGEDGQPRSDDIIWMLRLEPEGWRIAGMAQKIFDDELPLFLNFEDPEDMMRKQELTYQELERRAIEAQRQAAQPGAPGTIRQ